MFKYCFFLIFLIIGSAAFAQQAFDCDKDQLEDCPGSPNCFQSHLQSKSKWKKPLAYKTSSKEAMGRLKQLIASIPRTNLVAENDCFLHYTFTTKIGKFIDDVTFYFDPESSVIHFLSASRKGWYDFNANKRRMKKIVKSWGQIN